MFRIFSIALLIALLLPVGSFADNTAINFGGVGIDGIPRSDGQIVVKQLVIGGPAQVAGIRVGDIITHIDGKPTQGSDFRHMVDYRLRGRSGTKVQLNILRPGEKKPLRYILKRKQLVVETRK